MIRVEITLVLHQLSFSYIPVLNVSLDLLLSVYFLDFFIKV